MLVTAQPNRMQDPTLAAVLAAIGSGHSASGELKPGLVEISHFSADHAYSVKRSKWDERERFGCDFYGVSDTAEQAYEYAEKHLGHLPEKFCVFVTHVAKDPTNYGKGGGWRWHKWGPYIGIGDHTREYLDDEPEPAFANGVYVFHIHELS